jgi:hypothetical protein
MPLGLGPLVRLVVVSPSVSPNDGTGSTSRVPAGSRCTSSACCCARPAAGSTRWRPTSAGSTTPGSSRPSATAWSTRHRSFRKSGAGRPTVGRWCLLEALRTAENVLGAGAPSLRPRPPAVPHRSCHSRATSDGQPRYRADNHGHIHATDELVVLAGPARTHPANVPDKDEAGGSSPGTDRSSGIEVSGGGSRRRPWMDRHVSGRPRPAAPRR